MLWDGTWVDVAGGGWAAWSIRNWLARPASASTSCANERDHGKRLDRAETGFKITYAEPLLPGVTIQPDLQYVVNPSADPAIRDAVILGLRLTVTAGSGGHLSLAK